jgi:short-subunit dehydrogenase
METVLVVGSTGNIGVSAVIGALRSQRAVLAIVRNQASAEKLYKHVGTREGITTVEADITSDHGVRSIVDQVKAGKLPAFQHVYSAGIVHVIDEHLLGSYANVYVLASGRIVRRNTSARSWHGRATAVHERQL